MQQATSAKLLFGHHCVSGQGGTVALPFEGQFVRLKVTHDGTPVRIILSWNDFAEDADYRTPQDLDLSRDEAASQDLETPLGRPDPRSRGESRAESRADFQRKLQQATPGR